MSTVCVYIRIIYIRTSINHAQRYFVSVYT